MKVSMQPIKATDPLAQSADLVSENVVQLNTLFPEAFAEGKIDFDMLKQLLGTLAEEGEEKYGLNWNGKKKARQIALTPSTGTLRPVPGESVEWDTTKNLMIEGDNLEVLKLLQKSYSKSVKLIYIDPPYNTGNDFVYPDDFQDNIKNYMMRTGQIDTGGQKNTTNTESSGRFHTDWLNMMYPRLKLAHRLLKDDGLMLISIDDHEVENLRHLCGDVFGEENFIATFIWEKGRKNDAKLVSVGHEYLLLYAKSLGHLKELKTLWREEKPGAREIWDKYLELRELHGANDTLIEMQLQTWYGSLAKSHPSKKWSRYKRIDANGPWRDRDISWPGGDGPRYDVPHPITGLPCKVPEAGWRYASIEEMQRQVKLGLVEFRGDHTEPPFRKAHIRPIPDEILDEVMDATESDETDEEEFATQVRGSYFYKQSQVSVRLLRELMGKKIFTNPKDHFELKKLFNYLTSEDENALVMDFFAGSGSTGHAIMDLNVEDGGSRRFILVQLPELLDPSKKEQKASANYCERLGFPQKISELTKERLRRVGSQIRRDNPSYTGDVGFRVFKLDSSNIQAWDPNRDNLPQSLLDSAHHLKNDRTEQDILFEILLKLGLDLTVPIVSKSIAGKSISSIGAGTLIACLADIISSDEVEKLSFGIVAWYNELAPAGETTLVFRDSAFADDISKTNLTAILSQHGLGNVRSL